MNIAITGVTGNMGGSFLEMLNNSPDAADKITILCRSKKGAEKCLKKAKRIKDKIRVVMGGVDDPDACKNLIKNCQIVFNVCAVIPPKADNDPKGAIACNVTGVKNLIAAIESEQEQPTLVHISSVAVYGNRTGGHMFGRVGDPLVSGPFELYSATKILGEYAVLESAVKKWVVLRQTAMLHYNIFSDNIKDGLMFHTPVNAPLEWATVKDSGVLLLNLLKQFNTLPEKFWKRVYNIGGGSSCRQYGYQTYDSGFKIIGGDFKDFFKPYYNATRNFHGVYYSDSDVLENYLHFRSQSVDDFWREMARRHKIFKLGKIVPKKVIASLIIKPLLKDANSPNRWVDDGDDARATAYFGAEGIKAQEKRKALTWDDVTLLTQIPEDKPMTAQEKVQAYGYDIDKPDEDITAQDLISVAEAHGGKCLTPQYYNGDMYKKIEWQTSDGQIFSATAYSVLRAGHWEHALYHGWVWEFDKLCKTDRIFARIWYDSHEKDEDNKYYFDKDFKACREKIK